ncbi:MAG TPA: DUF3606 domain-containing protein [Puia sp.]
MPANKPKQDSRESIKSNNAAEEDSFEITYLQNKFLVSRQKVVEAMKASGNNRQQVETYLLKYTKKQTILL